MFRVNHRFRNCFTDTAHFSRVSGNSPSGAGAAAGLAAVSCGAAVSLRRCFLRSSVYKAVDIFFTTRPLLPEPVTLRMSTPFSRAYLRTEGIAITRLFGSTSA